MKKSWGFMTEHMPGVVAMLKGKRDKGESAHLDACWKNGVVRGEPGWFFASEAGVHIGTLWPEAAQQLIELRAMAHELAKHGAAFGMHNGGDLQPTLAPLLILRPIEGAGDGAH